jgi:hypothetical protein
MVIVVQGLQEDKEFLKIVLLKILHFGKLP